MRESDDRPAPHYFLDPSKANTMFLAAQCPSGRNAVVGASSGINLAIAHRLGSLGARIAIVSRSRERIEAAADTLRSDGVDVTPHAGDVRDATAMQAIMTEVADAKGPIDIVVSGAAGNFFVPAAKMSPNAFKTVIDIDLIGTFNVLSAAYPHLKRPRAVVPVGNSILLATDIESGDAPALCERSVA
jgi:NAD(P)-dependent dehydrogenase (short-subunit alcohol dehydrogenase family)